MLQRQRRNTPGALQESNGELYSQINQAFSSATVTMSKLFHAEDAVSGTESCSVVEIHLLMEVPRLRARTLQTDTFMVFQVQT